MGAAQSNPKEFALQTGQIAGNLMITAAGTYGVGKLAKFVKVAIAANVASDGVAWTLDNASSTMYDGTVLPKYFDAEAGGLKLHFSDSSLKHLAKWIEIKTPANPTLQEIVATTNSGLSKYMQALNSAIEANPNWEYNEKFYDPTRHWEFIISKGTGGQYDYMYHALYKSEGF